MLKNSLKITHFVLLMSFLNLVFFHFSFYNFVFQNLDYKSLNGIVIIISLVIIMLVVNAFVFYLLFSLSRFVGKPLLIAFFIINSVAVYFTNTYGIIIDKSMIGNILNTNYEESSGFFSFRLILYVISSGIIPAIYIIKVKIIC